LIPAVHASYVLDASVAAKWFTRHEEEDRKKAVALRDLHRHRRCRLVLPEFGLLEIVNAIRYSRRAEETDAAAALAALEQLGLEIAPLDWVLLRKANVIAWTYGIAVYDAAYVALAEQIGFPLITADEALVRKMRGHGIVVSLRELGIP
jgi:predicted nucleic acid-binding protein